MPFMLSDCACQVRTERELLIVGSDATYEAAKIGRDRTTQAILPVDPLFALSENWHDDSDNEEWLSLIAALGPGIVLPHDSSLFKIENLRYEKVIIVTEQGDAGDSLRDEVIRFFRTYMPPLISAGHIFVPGIPLEPGFIQEGFVKRILNPATRTLSVVDEDGNLV